MAFDQSTRNLLQRYVGQSRRLLTEEFTRQLQQEYGLDPETGKVSDLVKLNHLDDARLETARLLRQILAHYVASERANSGVTVQAVLERIVREQAFTILNRLAALRMAEARGLLIESIGNGYQAKGFQLYVRLAGTGLGETGDAYRVYLFSVFDELGQDLPDLFDRYSPQGRLFPREATMLPLLALINDADIESLWSEDETIGWIYQYFNSREERKSMRAAASAPRNSRELAVRNQFFTPRYVVEFLTDNTLGRIWYEMHKGFTILKEECRYLVRHANEVFLEAGEGVQADRENESNPSAEEPLRTQTHVVHRPKKDPRDLHVLDPACGSGHFLLYAFDLLERIYEEAWKDPDSPNSELTGRALGNDFETLDDLRRAAPKLIVEHNLHGIDIDARAVQIAALALWLRAQKAWTNQRLEAAERPRIARSNIVTAEPMPGEANMRREFTADLRPRVLGQLVDIVFDKMTLAGEAGSLLKIDEEITSSVAEAKHQWLSEPKLEQSVLFPELVKRKPEQQRLFDVTEITADEFWDHAEGGILAALKVYTERADNGHAVRRRLFAGDAARGFAFIDICGRRYDVILMNPPFGEAAERVRDYKKQTYPHSHQDIFQCFVERAIQFVKARGMVGVLSARTGFFMGDSESWRTEVLWRNQLVLFADLGLGVLDDALVEAAAYVIQRGMGDEDEIVASRHLATREKESSLLASIQAMSRLPHDRKDFFVISQNIIKRIPGGVFGYWAPVEFLKRFRESGSFRQDIGAVRQGLATADDFRFVRLSWEVVPDSIGPDRRWSRFSKGGEYSPPYDDIHLVVDWADDGKQLRSLSSARVQNEKWYHKAGATYTVRTASAFAAKVLPAGCVFSHNAQSWFVDDPELLLKSIVYFSCRVPQTYLEIAVGGGDISTSGSAARRYTTKVVHSIPASVIQGLTYEGFHEDCRDLFRLVAHDQSLDETTCFFSGHPLSECRNFDEFTRRSESGRQTLVTRALRASWRIDEAVTAAWNMSSAEIDFVRSEVGPHPCEYHLDPPSDAVRELLALPVDELIRRAVNQDGASRWLTKKSYFVDRQTELICHILRCSPESVEPAVGHLSGDRRQLAAQVVSYAVGGAFNRWDPSEADKGAVDRFVHSPFEELPQIQPTASESKSGTSILVDDKGHACSIVAGVERSIRVAWPANDGNCEQELASALGADLERYLRKDFFVTHLARYTKSRRKAPIYWPMATSSGSYTLWLYYPALTSQTLYTAVNDFIEPKLKQVSADVTALRDKGTSRSRAEEKQFETVEAFELELVELRDSLLKIAREYRPNHDDGVQITAAPLWSLFRHKPWQKVLKDTWVKLEKGDYDWAHLAMNYWPERVREKCKTDKSLAIAHGLEDLYVEPGAKQRKKRGRRT